MRRVLAALLPLLAAPLPAHAVTAVEITCTLRYGSVAPGTYRGSGTCAATGVVRDAPVVSGGGTMSFLSSAACPSQSMQGTITFAGSAINFELVRIGVTGVVATSGHVNGTGSAVFSGPCPAQNETVVITLTGT